MNIRICIFEFHHAIHAHHSCMLPCTPCLIYCIYCALIIFENDKSLQLRSLNNKAAKISSEGVFPGDIFADVDPANTRQISLTQIWGAAPEPEPEQPAAEETRTSPRPSSERASERHRLLAQATACIREVIGLVNTDVDQAEILAQVVWILAPCVDGYSRERHHYFQDFEHFAQFCVDCANTNYERAINEDDEWVQRNFSV